LDIFYDRSILGFGWKAFLEKDLFYNPYFGGGLNPTTVFSTVEITLRNYFPIP
jgi:hypothetical protein